MNKSKDGLDVFIDFLICLNAAIGTLMLYFCFVVK